MPVNITIEAAEGLKEPNSSRFAPRNYEREETNKLFLKHDGELVLLEGAYKGYVHKDNGRELVWIEDHDYGVESWYYEDDDESDLVEHSYVVDCIIFR